MAATKILQVLVTEAETGTVFAITDSKFISVMEDTLGSKITYERQGARVEQVIVTEVPGAGGLGGISINQGGADTPGTSGVLFPVTLADGSVEWINHLRILHREPWTSGDIRTKIAYDAYGARPQYLEVQETMAELTTTITSRNA